MANTTFGPINTVPQTHFKVANQESDGLANALYARKFAYAWDDLDAADDYYIPIDAGTTILFMTHRVTTAFSGGTPSCTVGDSSAADTFLASADIGETSLNPAIEAGFFQREIADAAYRYQLELDAREKIIVGVNEFVDENQQIDIPILEISPEVEVTQRRRITELRMSRNQQDVEGRLGELERAAGDGTNLMPRLLACTRAYATLGEMCSALTRVFGVYEEAAVFSVRGNDSRKPLRPCQKPP